MRLHALSVCVCGRIGWREWAGEGRGGGVFQNKIDIYLEVHKFLLGNFIMKSNCLDIEIKKIATNCEPL